MQLFVIAFYMYNINTTYIALFNVHDTIKMQIMKLYKVL